MSDRRPWHRVFVQSWQAFFEDTPVVVESEKDLSVQQQLLDVLILRRGDGPLDRTMPHGMEDLGPFNLITFKSMHESLDEWTLCELQAHFVAYRKLVSPTTNELRPVSEFRLYAISSRVPEGLTGRTPMFQVMQGVYDVPFWMGAIRLLVLNELPEDRRNSVLQVFASSPRVARFGSEHYPIRPTTCSLLRDLVDLYRSEGPIMAQAADEVLQRLKEEILAECTPTDFLKRLTPEQRLEGLPPEQLAARLKPEERLAGLSPEEILAVLPENVRELLRRKAGES